MQQGKDELGERQETSQAHTATLEFTPEAMPLPQLLGRQVGRKGVVVTAAPKFADPTLLTVARAPNEALAAGAANDVADGKAGNKAGVGAVVLTISEGLLYGSKQTS